MNFAIMGYGHIGKVHAAALSKLPDAHLTAIVDNVVTESDGPVYNSLIELKQSETPVDAVIIATPNGLHFRHAMKAIDNGWNVVVEKPVTLNSQDLERLLFHSESTGKRVFNMLQLRLSPVAQWVKKILNQQDLGEIYLVNVQCYWNRNEAYYQQRAWHGTRAMDGGVLFTQFSHFIDILHFWFEELKPKDIRNFNFNHQNCTEFPDSGLINFEIPTGGFGSMTYTISAYEKNFDSTITIIAEKGTVQIGGQYMNQVKYLNSPELQNPFETETEKVFHPAALAEVVEAVAENRNSILDAVNARNVIKFLELVS